MSITVLNEKAIAVKLPDDAHSFEIYENNVIGGFCVMYLRGEPDYACQYSPNLPPGQWSILGMSDVLTEEQWEKVVETVDYDTPPSPGNDFQGDWRTAWRDYESIEETGCSEFPFVRTATKSGQTLLRSKGVTTPHLILINQQSFK